jgi:hypothetical protein
VFLNRSSGQCRHPFLTTPPLISIPQALFIRLQLPSPFPNPFTHSSLYQFSPSKTPTLLVYSASTSLGLFAIQLAKLITPPIRVLATASPANHALLLSLGASKVFDYRSPRWVDEVKAASEGGIEFAVDCISEDKTTGMISDCFREGEGEGEKRIAVIRKVAWDKSLVRKDVTAVYGAAWSGLGHEIIYNSTPAIHSTHTHTPYLPSLPLNPRWNPPSRPHPPRIHCRLLFLPLPLLHNRLPHQSQPCTPHARRPGESCRGWVRAHWVWESC